MPGRPPQPQEVPREVRAAGRGQGVPRLRPLPHQAAQQQDGRIRQWRVNRRAGRGSAAAAPTATACKIMLYHGYDSCSFVMLC